MGSRGWLRVVMVAVIATVVLTGTLPAAPVAADTSLRAVEQHLRDLGYPVGAVDGGQDGTRCGRYCPDVPVTRAQMASFELPPGPVDGFVDVEPTSTHAAAVGAVRQSEITVGSSPDGRSYCPSPSVRRGQMASFFIRALDHRSP